MKTVVALDGRILKCSSILMMMMLINGKNRIRLGHIEAAILCITVCFSKEENKKFKSWDVAMRIDLSDETLSTKIFYKP